MDTLFVLDGHNIVDIRSNEDSEYIESGCSTCGGDWYYTNELIFIADDKKEFVVDFSSSGYSSKALPTFSFLVRFFNDNEVKSVIKDMTVDQFLKYFSFNWSTYTDFLEYEAIGYNHKKKRDLTYDEWLNNTNDYIVDYLENVEGVKMPQFMMNDICEHGKKVYGINE